MRRPQHPQSPFHTPSDAGARNSVAGLSVEQRVAALEESTRGKVSESLLTTRGDLIRRGASAPERVALGASGYALTSDGTDPVWKPTGRVASGLNERTADAAASTAAGAYLGAADQLSITVTGDNANKMRLHVHFPIVHSSAASHLVFRVFDGTSAGTLLQEPHVSHPGGTYYMPVDFTIDVAAFSGSKTFTVYVLNGGGVATTITLYGSSVRVKRLTATWV